MNIFRTGIILNAKNYRACVAVCRDLSGLKILFEDQQGAAKLRFNVANLGEALKEVQAFGIRAEITTYAWVSSIDIHDPDGSRIGIRDEAGFSIQLES